jgi:hypothetical protein
MNIRTKKADTQMGICFFALEGTRKGNAYIRSNFQTQPSQLTVEFWLSADPTVA